MKVAIAGTGDVSAFLQTTLASQNHDVVVLTRREPSTPLPVPHRVTDYTVPSLLSVLHDRTALISTVSSYDQPEIVTPVHLALLEAVEKSETVKYLIPSEWTSDALNYPDQPMFMREHQSVLYAAMREAKARSAGKLQFTVVCNSWFLDYVVPPENRGLREIGEMWPMDHAKREFTIYGSGEQKISFATTRDVAVAVGKLLEAGEKGVEWEEFTFLEAERLTWNELYEVVNEAQVGGGKWTKKTKSLSETVDTLVALEKVMESGKGGQEEAVGILMAQFELLSYSGASLLPWEEVERQRGKYFEGVRWRGVREVLKLVKGEDEIVV